MARFPAATPFTPLNPTPETNGQRTGSYHKPVVLRRAGGVVSASDGKAVRAEHDDVDAGRVERVPQAGGGERLICLLLHREAREVGGVQGPVALHNNQLKNLGNQQHG